MKALKATALCCLLLGASQAVKLQESNKIWQFGETTETTVAHMLDVIMKTAEKWKEENLRNGKPLTKAPIVEESEEKTDLDGAPVDTDQN